MHQTHWKPFDVVKEDQERSSRQNNRILYNVPESCSEDKYVRIAHDLEETKTGLHDQD